MKKAVLIEEKDNVLTVLEDILPGEWVGTGTETIQAMEGIPLYHKIARSDIAEGEVLYKYGQPMGYALCDIRKGQWVHTHNADSAPPGTERMKTENERETNWSIDDAMQREETT